jgi:Tfp pilus assembly protein PilO
MGDDNGGKWYGTSKVVNTLFWIVFCGVVGWGTYVWTRTEQAHTKADGTITKNEVQDEQIKTIRADLTEIRNDQKEILRRLPR